MKMGRNDLQEREREKTNSITHLVKTVAREVFRDMFTDSTAPHTVLGAMGADIRSLNMGADTLQLRVRALEQKDVKVETLLTRMRHLSSRCNVLEQNIADKRDDSGEDIVLPLLSRRGQMWTVMERTQLDRELQTFISATAGKHGRTARSIRCRLESIFTSDQ